MGLTVGKRIYAVFGILAFFFCALLFMNRIQTSRIISSYQVNADTEIPKLALIRNITQESANVQRNFYNILLTEDEASHEKYSGMIADSRSKNAGYMKEIGELLHDPASVESYAKLKEARTNYYVQLDEALPVAMKNEKARALALNNAKVRPGFLGYQEGLSAFSRQIVESAKANSEAIRNGAERTNGLMTLVGALVLFACFALTVWQIRWVLTSLRKVCVTLSDSSFQVGAASAQLSSASTQLSSGATEGAASLEETVASIEQLSSMVKQNAEYSSEAATLSQASRQSADDGEAEIRKLTTAMSEIDASSKKIEEIINVIDDIAFQTNLLALNAAVEAARAGEQGKGFAVVAEAVRGLAQRSASAAKDISGLIKESVQKTEIGSKTADQSGVVLKRIVDSVKKVADLNAEIASASRQQSEGISQISGAMNQLDKVTQTNAASAEEAAASSEELSAQAGGLRKVVDQLSFMIEGKVRQVSDERAVSRAQSEWVTNP